MHIIVIGCCGPPASWMPLAQTAEACVTGMLLPFAPDDTSEDEAIIGNIVEYARAGTFVEQAGIAQSSQTLPLVAIVGGVDRRARVELLTERLPDQLASNGNHLYHPLFLYFAADTHRNALYQPLLDAQMSGYDVHAVPGNADTFDEAELGATLTEWLASCSARQP